MMNTEVILEGESDVIWQRHTTSKGPIVFCLLILMVSCCFVTVSRLTLSYPMDSSKPGFPVLRCLLKFAQIYILWVGDAIQPSHPLLPPPPPALSLSQHQGIYQWVWSSHQRPKYWSFNFSISPSNGYSGLILFMIDQFDLLAVEGTLKSLPQHHNLKASVLQCLFYGPTLISIEKPELWLHRPMSTKWCVFPLIYYTSLSWASMVAQMVKNPPAMRETWAQSLDWGDLLKDGVTTQSSILAWRIPMERISSKEQVSFNVAVATTCSDFGAEENKICHSFHSFPIYFPWSDGAGCHDLSFF